MLLGIDFGLKCCGVAITDSSMVNASPLAMVPSDQIMNWLIAYCTSHSIKGIVLGFPLSVDGSDTHITQNVKLFKEALQKEFTSIPIHLQDERHSSQRAAHAIHIAGKKKHGKDKGVVDKVSAAIILQDFLNEQPKN